MDYFLNSYDYSLDDKNRLSIPAKFRKVMSQIKQTSFIISCLENSCLTLYPADIFEEKIVKRLEDLPQMDEDANELRRAIAMNSEEVDLDNQGRIVLPANFKEHAGIDKKVKIVGMMNKIELWNPETFTKVSRTPDAASIKSELKKYRI